MTMSKFSILLVPVMIVCLLVVAYLMSLGRYSTKNYDALARHSSLDGLRGMLAIFVLTHHFYITYMWKIMGQWVSPSLPLLDNLGAVAVSLFFMLTGYLFIRKIRGKEFSWWELYRGRVKRIYPLYLFAGAVVMLLTAISTYGEGLDIKTYVIACLRWLFFKDAQIGAMSTSRMIAGVNWTLLYEWGFYLSLPIIGTAFFRKGNSLDFKMLMLIPFLIYALYSSNSRLYFLFVLAAITTLNMKFIRMWVEKYRIVSGVLVTLLLAGTLVYSVAYSLTQMLLVFLIFLMVVNKESLFGLLTRKGMKVLGDISYSIYLMHGLVLYIMFSFVGVYDFDNGALGYLCYYPLVVALTVGVSHLTYQFVERRFLKANHR